MNGQKKLELLQNEGCVLVFYDRERRTAIHTMWDPNGWYFEFQEGFYENSYPTGTRRFGSFEDMVEAMTRLGHLGRWVPALVWKTADNPLGREPYAKKINMLTGDEILEFDEAMLFYHYALNGIPTE